MTLATALLTTSLWLAGLAEPPSVSPVAFQQWFEDSLEGRMRMPEAVVQRARGFRYVFVAGLWNERMGGYFAQNAKELRASGVPRSSIHTISPSSEKSVDENRDAVREAFLDIADKGPEPLVVIAHSRGACDALAFALQNPRFVRDHVRAFFLVQGPFGGSPVADFVLGEGHELDSRMPPAHRLLAQVIGKLERGNLSRGKHSGLLDLTQSASLEFWERTLTEHIDAVPLIGPRVFYVTTRTRPSRLRLFQRSCAWYVGTYFGPSDGLVEVEAQSIDGLGTCLGVFRAGHTDLTRGGLGTKASRNVRVALVQSILMAVGQERSKRPADPGEERHEVAKPRLR